MQRTLSRQELINAAKPSPADLQFLGIQTPAAKGDSAYPLIKLKSLQTEKFSEVPVLAPRGLKHHYKAFQNAIVTPVHRIFGSIKNVLALVFKIQTSASYKKNLNIIISQFLRENDLPLQAEVFNIGTAKSIRHRSLLSSVYFRCYRRA